MADESLETISNTFKQTSELPSWLVQNYRIHQQIRMIRETLGMTQTQLAAHIGARQSAIAKIENDLEHDFRISTLARIAEALNCQLMVSLVPKQKLSDYVQDKALEKAKQLTVVMHTSDSAQDPGMSVSAPDAEIQRLKDEIVQKRRKILWDIPQPEESESQRLSA